MRSTSRTLRPDHPRSRGVYVWTMYLRPGCAGSSPLARGLRTVPRREAARLRIIPARAGFTAALSLSFHGTRDHPRSRGVYARTPLSRIFITGSSPLARGLRQHAALKSGERGIIPARAGFTTTGPRRSRRTRDHPRSRGVYAFILFSWSERTGSSPLARGLRALCFT